MNADTIFNLSNLLVLPFWLLMILLPRWQWSRRIMASLWPVALVPFVYAGLLLAMLGSGPPLPDMSLPGIAAGLGTPAGAAIAWAHFLAFDLFVGRWAYLDGRRLALTPWLASLTLFFIFMAGPLGLLLHLALRRTTWVSLATSAVEEDSHAR